MKTVISTPNAPGAIGPYSQGYAFGDLVITSGQIPVDPATGSVYAPLLSIVSGYAEAQASGVTRSQKADCFFAFSSTSAGTTASCHPREMLPSPSLTAKVTPSTILPCGST